MTTIHSELIGLATTLTTQTGVEHRVNWFAANPASGKVSVERDECTVIFSGSAQNAKHFLTGYLTCWEFVWESLVERGTILGLPIESGINDDEETNHDTTT